MLASKGGVCISGQSGRPSTGLRVESTKWQANPRHMSIGEGGRGGRLADIYVRRPTICGYTNVHLNGSAASPPSTKRGARGETRRAQAHSLPTRRRATGRLLQLHGIPPSAGPRPPFPLQIDTPDLVTPNYPRLHPRAVATSQIENQKEGKLASVTAGPAVGCEPKAVEATAVGGQPTAGGDSGGP